MLAILSRLDHWLSAKLSVCAGDSARFGPYRWTMKALEWLVHEVVVFPGILLLIALAIPHHLERSLVDPSLSRQNPLHDELPEFLAILFGLLLEVLAVSIIKMLFKRPRPPSNVHDMQSAFPGVDQYSFPSGHASRMAMLAFLASDLYSDLLYAHPFAWPLAAMALLVPAVSVSRVCLGRHFPSDVVAGIVLGVVMAQLIMYGLIPFFEHFSEPISSVLGHLHVPVYLLISTS